MLKIDLLYFDGCPSYKTGLENLKAALERGGIQAEPRLVLVRDDQDAGRLKFLGSPSFQVGGVDLWPEERESYALSCRLYFTPQGLRGAPSAEMLLDRLRLLQGGGQSG